MPTTKDTKEKPVNKQDNHELLQDLVEQNAELLQENNRLLKKMHRNAKITFWMRVVWYLFLIGFPFALYFYVLEPYFTAFGSSYENFVDGLNELPGFRGIEQLLDYTNGGE